MEIFIMGAYGKILTLGSICPMTQVTLQKFFYGFWLFPRWSFEWYQTHWPQKSRLKGLKTKNPPPQTHTRHLWTTPTHKHRETWNACRPVLIDDICVLVFEFEYLKHLIILIEIEMFSGQDNPFLVIMAVFHWFLS